VLADSRLPRPPWSPAPGPRERRAAVAALAISVAGHLAALGLLPDWRASAPPAPQPIQVTLLVPSLPPPATPHPEAAIPAPTPRVRPEPVAKAAPAETRPRQTPLVRSEAAPAAPSVSLPATSPEPATQAAESTSPAPSGLAAAAPAPSPHAAVPAPVTDPALLARYGQTLSGLLARQQQYPRMAAARGWEGEVVLRLVIARKGSLVSARVLHSSGHPVLDEHALALVAEVQPFPALPGQVPGDDLEVTVPVHYQLNKKS
jgi:periplasmic protein TonB